MFVFMISIFFCYSCFPKSSDPPHEVHHMEKMLYLDAIGICARLSVVVSHRPSELLSRRGDEAQVLLDILHQVFILLYMMLLCLTILVACYSS